MWPEIVKQQLGDIEFHNLGQIGAGNQFIAHQVNLADARHKFSSDDLIMICWTHPYRMDWFLESTDRWRLEGNMFYYGQLSSKVPDEFKDLNNCLIRDFRLIYGVKELLDSNPCDTIHFAWQEYDCADSIPFHKTISKMFKHMTWNNAEREELRKQCWISDVGNHNIDMHPLPLENLQILENLGMYFSKDTKLRVEHYHQYITNIIGQGGDDPAWKILADYRDSTGVSINLLD